ncbi:fungal specific transcription factor domain-containing protein [Trichoderma breve]|uniref:Fungal specific transcription factor domain-containing protein n=1 Tax=Trichoderma breve TaxID=2034170 RepID=A0A9W9E241_9HYPO|nr:fungal specific transcription factor domain-containing protein [Trichoderma breve]KAJ4855633.1 fungal specific transcription factor domain-containing protein [Trichoderma breve]
MRSPARSAGGEDEGSPHPDELPACLSCRRRKSRCSRERPSCAQCLKIGAECQYVVKQKPGIKAGAVDSLSRRLETLEQILLDTSGNTKARLVALLNGDLERPMRNELSPTTSPSMERQQGPYGASRYADQDSLAETAPQSDHHRRKRQRIGDEQDRYCDTNDDAWITPLPQYPLLEAVVEAHFQTVHHWIPILHETRFRAKFKDPAQRQRLTVLLHALLSAGIKYVDCTAFGMSIQDVTRQIRISRSTVMENAMESLSIENTQALVIIAFDYMGSGHVQRAWPIIASLTRVVDYLQLTVEPDEDSPKQPLLRSLTVLEKPLDWTDSEARRRLFWSVFLLDRICSVTTGWHTSLTSDDVHRRLPCGGAMWARAEPVSTPYFGIWDKSTAKIGNSISSAPTIYVSPKVAIDHPSPGSNGDVDVSKLGAFAYCIEATENLSQVTSFFLQQSVNFGNRDEVKNWLTRFKELDLRLVHWKMFLPKQWQDSNVSRDVLILKLDPNLTLAHVSHNTSMILLHQHIAYPPARWKNVVKLPSSCSAETCHLAAVETSSIVQKYLRFMGGIVNAQFAFCAFVAARILLIHWHSSETHTLETEFFNLLQSLKDMSDKWHGYYTYGSTFGSAPDRQRPLDLAGRYAEQLESLHSRCLNDVTFSTIDLIETLGDASLYGFIEATVQPNSVISPSGTDYRNHNGQSHRRYSSGFEAYQRAGVPSPTRASDMRSNYQSHRSPARTRHSATYGVREVPQPQDDMSSQSGVGQSPLAASSANANLRNINGPSIALMNDMNAANSFPHNQSMMAEEDELTTMSNMLLGNQFLEMDRVISLQGADFFAFDSTRGVGLSG